MAESPLAPWRDASLIFLSLQAFILLLVPVVILYFMNRGAHWLLVRVRPAFALVREKVDDASAIVAAVCAKIASPFIAGRALISGVQAGWRAILRALGWRGSA